MKKIIAVSVLALVAAAPAIARNGRAWRWPVTVLGGLGALFLLWALHSVSGQGNFLYEGGFLLVAVAAVCPRTEIALPAAPGPGVGQAATGSFGDGGNVVQRPSDLVPETLGDSFGNRVDGRLTGNEQ